jgi:hypothetical protein
MFACNRANPQLGFQSDLYLARQCSHEAGLHVLNLRAKLVFCSAQSLLEATQKLVLFALGKLQIVVSQLTVFLFQFALNFVPTPLYL